ncbi:MAG: peptidylprolyl isomerase [Planctomycetota bacterium]|jgi:hypothetical protein|nr:peptidylprolyl isomerase [Planctomycetota bacterium]
MKWLIGLLGVWTLVGCGPNGLSEKEKRSVREKVVRNNASLVALRELGREIAARPEHEAHRVKVAHILISFAGAGIPEVTRSRIEAEKEAARILERIESGEDFLALMRVHSDDSGPGVYPMIQSTRSQMVPGFGAVGWRLKIGEVGLAPYDSKKSPYGWHLIKRLE